MIAASSRAEFSLKRLSFFRSQFYTPFENEDKNLQLRGIDPVRRRLRLKRT
jgi:hypothetical protein